MNIVVKMKFGSHLYGTSTPLATADVDPGSDYHC